MATPKFRPYRGTDEKIKSLPQQPGYIYFATDTGRIYLDYENQRLTMGGNGASLYYANDEAVDKDLLDNYFIDIDTILEAGSSLKVNDLIINSDGAFYRIIEVLQNERLVKCLRLAVSGTGSGDSGGSGGPTQKNIQLELIGDFPITFVYGKKSEVTFKATAEFDTIVRYNVVIQGNNDSKAFNYEKRSGEEFVLDIGSLLYQGNNVIVITAFGDNSGETKLTYPYRESIVFALKKNPEFNPRVVQEGVLNFYCIPVGSTKKTLEIYIDGTLEITEVLDKTVDDRNYTVNIPKQAHGTHTIEAILSADINGAYVTTDPISYQIAWYDSTLNNPTPLIWFPEQYPEKIVQYEDYVVEYMVWHPEQLTDIETHYYKNAVKLPSSPRYLNYDSSLIQKWNITDYNIGSNNYTIQVGSTSKAINFEVEKDENRNLDIIAGGLVLNLEASGRSNEENIGSRTTWISKNTEIKTSVNLENFNWYNNGWMEDEFGKSCLRISNGASIDIPIGPLNILNSTRMEKALTLEFRFKIRNIQEYATLIETISSEDENGNVSIEKITHTDKGVIGQLFNNNIGFCIGTQEAFMKSSNTVVNARYKEDEIINLTFVIDSNSAMSLIYIYLQGILSGVAKYGTSDNFNADATSIVFNSEYCDIDLYNVRIYSGPKLESVDVVHNYISDLKDVKSYDANQIVTTVNQIPTIDYKKMLDYNDKHPEETIIPYMVIESRDIDNKLPYIKGGKKAVNIEFKNPALDYAYNKGYIDADKYLHGAPSFTYTSAEKSLDVQGTSSQGYPRRNYKWKAKQKDAKWRYTAGPLRGYPIYEYNADQDKYVGQDHGEKSYKKFYLDSQIGETTFCFKADYMESSGTHNTGFASYVSNLYSKHPLKDYIPNASLDALRTTVYGFPMLVFQKTGTDTYEFVGRYNFNLDKGATDSCGFTYEGDSFVKGEDGKFLPFEEVAECWEIKNNQGQRTSFVKTDFEETTDAYNEIELTSDKFEPNKYYIVTHINTSSGEKTYELATEYDINKIYYTKQSGVLSLLDDFEYRYSAFEDEIDHAIDGTDEFASAEQSVRNEAILYRMRNFKEMALWLESTDISISEKLGSDFGEYTEIVLTEDEFIPGVHYIWNETYKIWKKTLQTDIFDSTKKYATCVPHKITLKDGTEWATDDDRYRLAKFRTEFEEHFDKEYCMVYFIMTELLHLYDSRGKNCMLASWGPHSEGGNYIWYPIFYDIDTQLGINNSGVPTWDYYVEPTGDKSYSTSNSVLWNNLWAVFENSIKSKYGELRAGAEGIKLPITIEAMDGYYNSHPILGRGEIDSWKDIEIDEEGMPSLLGKINSYAKIGKKPAMIYNVDQYYKYISPAVKGYINTSGGTSTTSSFFYCLQGSRELMRYLYLRNRLNYLDSEWHAGSYSTQGAVGHLKIRYDANLLNVTSDAYLYTSDINLHNTQITEKEGTYTLWNWDNYGPHPLDCTIDFKGVRPFLRQYMSLQTDTSVYTPEKYDGSKEFITLNVLPSIQESIKNQPALTQQLVYVGGGEYIADIGDLGLKYLDEFIGTTLKRLISLRLGSDVEGYFNGQLNSRNCQIGANAYNLDGSRNQEAKTLLQEIILTGLNNLDGELDVSGSEKLKTLRALKTSLTSVVLADGVQIETLHLPKTITNITLVEPVALSGILTTKTVSPTDKGLFIEEITNSNGDYSKDIAVDTYAITGGNLKYDSYKLLDILVNFKKAMIERETTASKELSINLKNVNWSPYSLVEYGETYDEEKAALYYVDNQRYSLEAYVYEEETWEYYTKNGRIYIIDPTYANNNANVAVDLNIFDTFIESYEEALEYYNSNKSKLKNYFKSATSVQPISIPEITGMIYVNNTTFVDEERIANYYQRYFPKLKFFFKNVTQSYASIFVTLIDGIETIIYSERKPIETDDLQITYPSLDSYTPIRLNYDFVGWSLNPDAIPGSAEVYHPNYSVNFESEWSKLKYTNTNSAIKFYAIFDSTKFAVHFNNYYKDGQIENIITEYVVAGEYLYAPDILPSTDESDLPDDERYKLIGWVSDTKYCYPESEAEGKKYTVNLNTMVSEGADKTFYACYIKENVLDSITNINYFTFVNKTYTDPYDSSYNISGYYCIPKAGVKLTGKITIPDKYNNQDVIGIQNFDGGKEEKTHEITHIYFKEPDKIRVLDHISDHYTLKVFKFPRGLRRITDTIAISSPAPFKGNNNLRFDEEGFASCKLAEIDKGSFSGSFDLRQGGIALIQLPGSVRKIGMNAFATLGGTGTRPPKGQYFITEVRFGGPNDPCYFDFNTLAENAAIFQQRGHNLDSDAPSDVGANRFTTIKTFTYYKDPTNLTLDQNSFENYIKSGKVLGTNSTLNIQLLDADSSIL